MLELDFRVRVSIIPYGAQKSTCRLTVAAASSSAGPVVELLITMHGFLCGFVDNCLTAGRAAVDDIPVQLALADAGRRLVDSKLPRSILISCCRPVLTYCSHIELYL